MRLRLQPLPDEAQATGTFLVMQRAGNAWSVGARIIGVGTDEGIAEAVALRWKQKNPQQTFGVFMLRSEARDVENPIEIVRIVE